MRQHEPLKPTNLKRGRDFFRIERYACPTMPEVIQRLGISPSTPIQLVNIFDLQDAIKGLRGYYWKRKIPGNALVYESVHGPFTSYEAARADLEKHYP